MPEIYIRIIENKSSLKGTEEGLTGFSLFFSHYYLKSRLITLSMNNLDNALHHWVLAGILTILPVGVIMGVLLGIFIQFFGISLNT